LNAFFGGGRRSGGGGGGFNFEIEKRVHERVSELMSVPVTMLGLVEQYAQTDVFEPPFLRPHQKDDIFRFLWTVWREFNVDLYYGQEDGLFLGIIKGSGTYLEGRGSNGYMLEDSFDGISNRMVSEEDAYFKRLYYEKCLDRENGAPQNCTLAPSEDYVACVNNCKSRPCPSSVPSTTTSASSTENITSIAITEVSTPIYCPSYEILQVPEAHPLGYIPRYYYCLNNGGKFIENDPPNSVASPATMKNGVCTHSDGITRVKGETATKQTYAMADKRNYLFIRDYDYPDEEQADAVAHWLHTDDPTNIDADQKSDQMFVGGHHSRRYEPRLRPWYIGTREIQNAFWTNPYPFATNNDMGISFGKPLYYTDPLTGHKVFRGVICVDYDLIEISRFLSDVFLEIIEEVERDAYPLEEVSGDKERNDETTYSSSSGATVLIVEDDAPHYIIGTSTGSKAAKKVRVDDESINCEDAEIFAGTFDCKTVRSTPRDYLNANSSLDVVMALAFEEQKEAGFPKQLVISKASISDSNNRTGDDDDTGPKFYVSQSLIYEQSEGENLRWRIIVAMPVVISMNDGLFYGDPMFLVVLCVGIIGCVVCLLLFHFYFSKRKKTEVRMSDWRFTSAFILACALLNLTTLTYIGPATDQSCMLRMWSFHLVFVLVLAPLLVKVWRIVKLVGSADRAVRLSITNSQTLLYTMPPIFLQICILTLFSIFDPSKENTSVAIEGSSSSQHSICEHDTAAFKITQIVFEGSLVFSGCILAFKTRNLSSTLGEAKQLGFAMYNVGLVAVIVLLMGSFLHVDQKTVYVIITVGTFWATVFSSSAFVIPRLLQVQKRRNMRRKRGSDQSNSFYSYSGPLIVPSTQSRGVFQGGSLMNEPRSQMPVSSINSSLFQGSSGSETEEQKNNTPCNEPSNMPLKRSLNDVVYRTSPFESDIEENHDDSDSDESLVLGKENEKQDHRETSFTKLSISPSESEVLQNLAREENATQPVDSSSLHDGIEVSNEFETGDFVINLERSTT